jgi:hypothetical protein
MALPDPEIALMKRRRVCAAAFMASAASYGIEARANGDNFIFKSPYAGGIMAQEFLKAGIFADLGECGFRTIMFADGRYFSAIWHLPPSTADIDQITLVAGRERKNTAAADDATMVARVWAQNAGALRAAVREQSELEKCRALYPDDAAAFETCRLGLTSRAHPP